MRNYSDAIGEFLDAVTTGSAIEREDLKELFEAAVVTAFLKQSERIGRDTTFRGVVAQIAKG